METFMITTMWFSLVAMIFTILNLIRLQIFSKTIRKIIDTVHDNRVADMRNNIPYSVSIERNPYPDVPKSYDNFSFLTFWRRPSSMIVYSDSNDQEQL